MKIVKALILGLVLTVSTGLFAQTAEEIGTAQTELMTAELDLNPTQVERARYLNIMVAQKIEAIENNSDFTAAQKEEYIAGNKSDRRSAFKAILTEDQFEGFLEIEDQL